MAEQVLTAENLDEVFAGDAWTLAPQTERRIAATRQPPVFL